MPGMPAGKPAGVACIHLTTDRRCALFGRPERPAFCVGLRPLPDMCGENGKQALRFLARLERDTKPD